MIQNDEPRDLAALVVPPVGSAQRVEGSVAAVPGVRPAGVVVGPVAVYLRDLQAAGRAETTLWAYATALLRWFRFLWAIGLAWDQAPRVEARDFCRWIQIADKPRSARHGTGRSAVWPGAEGTEGRPNPVTGKRSPGRRYARRPGRTRRACCGASTSFTGRWAAGRW